jgi:hypothetical protein
MQAKSYVDGREHIVCLKNYKYIWIGKKLWSCSNMPK